LDVLGFYLLGAAVLASAAAWVAERRGRHFWVYFVFTAIVPGSAFISIPYLLIFARRVEREDAEPELEHGDRINRLERLAALRDRGALSVEEFEAEKARLRLDPDPEFR
jgi:hypothetical protein